MPVPEIVFKMVALGFEHIVVFVFCLPATSTRTHHPWNRLGIEWMVSYKGIVIKHFAISLTGKGQFAPVDPQVRLGVSQRHLIDIAVAVNLF